MKRALILFLCLAVFIGCSSPFQEAYVPAETPARETLPSDVPSKQPIVAEVFSVAQQQSPTPPPAMTYPPTPEPTATPEPTQTPAPAFVFIPSLSMPLPGPDYPLHKGMSCTVDGTVQTRDPLTALIGSVLKEGKSYQQWQMDFSVEENLHEYRFLDETYSHDIRCFAEELKFQSLRAGKYTFVLEAEAGGDRAELYRSDFSVEDGSYIQLIPNMMRGNYEKALSFFGSEDRFLFRFKFYEGRKISLNKEWSEKYVGSCNGLKGHRWQCHVDAAPYFDLACQYMETSYFNLHMGTRSTGPTLLQELEEMNGTMVRRFTNDGAFVSHHSFGTAVDMNAYASVNKNKASNKELIYNEVSQKLLYNGLIETDGILCYDFTYTGNMGNLKAGVPEVLWNYLLYELAFYRAGFSWGLYYAHTSDAMHFSLSELSAEYFESGPLALRKVYEYAP